MGTPLMTADGIETYEQAVSILLGVAETALKRHRPSEKGLLSVIMELNEKEMEQIRIVDKAIQIVKKEKNL